MSDCIRIDEGRFPWDPASNGTPTEVLDRYDVPRAGFVTQSGTAYYFECIVGDGSDFTLWAYVHVDEFETRQLLSVSEPDEVDALSDELFRNRWVTVAAADSDFRIVYFTNIDAGDEPRRTLARRMVNHWTHQVETNSRINKLVTA